MRRLLTLAVNTVTSCVVPDDMLLVKSSFTHFYHRAIITLDNNLSIPNWPLLVLESAKRNVLQPQQQEVAGRCVVKSTRVVSAAHAKRF